MGNMILILIAVPLLAGFGVLFAPNKGLLRKDTIALVSAILSLVVSLLIFGKEMIYNHDLYFGMQFSLRSYYFNSVILAATALFSLLIISYCVAYLKGKGNAGQIFACLLLSQAFVSGAVLADNLILMLFFWEGLLTVMFAFIYIGGVSSFKTAVKTFIIIGISDLTMMAGICLTASLAGTFTISQIRLELTPIATLAFILLMIGAIAKAGAMPFHSWIPDAAIDAPLPFMAILPASLEKLLGIYFLTRISLDMFVLKETSWISFLMMTIGAVTIILAVMMALIQKDYKKLLSYHAISQVGYMILGIGTAVPAGIIGGLFHMMNNALYKSCLFLTAGAVEHQTGTTDLSKLGGLAKKMPITFACFIVAALSISGVPPFNGFFSKELVYDAALERGLIFYIAAAAGSFFTAASFLKLGHAAFLGKASKDSSAKEESWWMLVPMIIIACVCVLFGLFNSLPINKLFMPVLGGEQPAHNLAGWPASIVLVTVTVIILLFAFVIHYYNAHKKKSGLKASDYIHYAPVLHSIYDAAEKRYFDPYDIGLIIINAISRAAFILDRAVDWLYGGLSAGFAYLFSEKIRQAHNGNHAFYLVWSIVAAILAVTYMMISKGSI